MRHRMIIASLACLSLLGMARAGETDPDGRDPVTSTGEEHMAKATFGAGCFWCVEAVFQEVPGVGSVTSGYSGGEKEDPTYKQVCSGDTGHAEVIEIEYDPEAATYEKLLDVFWKSHDPTQVNRQGADVGTQYRSVIFYHDEDQKAAAEKSKAALELSGRHDKPIATEIVSASEFYAAEEYHQDYYEKNPYAPYSMYIRTKLEKLGMGEDD